MPKNDKGKAVAQKENPGGRRPPPEFALVPTLATNPMEKKLNANKRFIEEQILASYMKQMRALR